VQQVRLVNTVLPKTSNLILKNIICKRKNNNKNIFFFQLFYYTKNTIGKQLKKDIFAEREYNYKTIRPILSYDLKEYLREIYFMRVLIEMSEKFEIRFPITK